ncbi:MAG: ParB-like protein [Halobacteriota archaeon]
MDLRPTQFAVGMLEVDEKIAMAKKFGKKQRQDFIDETPVPVVVAPTGELYVVDHHHFLCVCYHIGIKKVRIIVSKNLSKTKMTYAAFWKWMFKTRSAYPFCQFGEGPREAVYLPKDIRGLADDPYRSLAWLVRKAGAFESSEKNFAEFKWANFFRKRHLLDQHGPYGIPKALVKAAKLAQTPAAKSLPGFGKLNLKDTTRVSEKIKTKAREIIQSR